MSKFLDSIGVGILWNKIKSTFIPVSQKGAAGGVASLDNTGKVPAAQLPSYVDDVLEGYLHNGKFYKESGHNTEITAESGKIYIDLTNNVNKTYRWSGTTFGEIASGLALGETEGTAYPGNKGKMAYDHSQSTHAPVNAAPNVQSDWNVTNASSDAFIRNKPVSLPANGGDAATVNGHSVSEDVPPGAKFTDTTYSDMKGATSAAAGTHGLVPAPAAGSQTAKYLRADGTWQIPPNTTYGPVTSSSNGLMISSDKVKLDGIEPLTESDINSILV